MPDSQGDPLLIPVRQAVAESSARLRSRRRRRTALVPAWLERVQSL